MREIQAADISAAVARMCVSANTRLPDDVRRKFEEGLRNETTAAGKEIFRQLLENADLAFETKLPLCQDCGLAIFYVELGEDVFVPGGVNAAITEGMVAGYKDGFLRKSSCDPLSRRNTGDNTPAIIHIDLKPGDALKISYMAKGGGSENMSRVTMLSPSQGWEGIKQFVVQRVVEAGPNPCPPIILGIGIGGTFELAPKIAKQALLRKLDDLHPDPKVAEMEAELLAAVNRLGIGPMGLGGSYTCLGVKIALAPCHIASLPLAVNVQCHSARHEEVEF
ncbi:MAG: fumarate hydratase [Proteobacteria bacterium]|nr:fumarate hydratase [Pseudomonadota bacterium]MBU1596634.1 fumarate hydratase [Pseudomonadota bacterium]